MYASLNTRAGLAGLRDLTAEDVESVVHYWFASGDEFLAFLGIDRARLGTEEDTRQRFIRAIPTGKSGQRTIAFAITLNDRLAGYTLLNRYSPEDNYSHWHITNTEIRASGISTALYPYRIKTYFDLFPIERLTHQTRTRNLAVNRMLDKYIPVAETHQIDDPDGFALPGEFHLRYVRRGDVGRLLAKGEALRNGAPHDTMAP